MYVDLYTYTLIALEIHAGASAQGQSGMEILMYTCIYTSHTHTHTHTYTCIFNVYTHAYLCIYTYAPIDIKIHAGAATEGPTVGNDGDVRDTRRRKDYKANFYLHIHTYPSLQRFTRVPPLKGPQSGMWFYIYTYICTF